MTFSVIPDPLMDGKIIPASAQINPFSSDKTPGNNQAAINSVIRNSFDPNAKEVTPKGVGSAGAILPSDSVLTYTIYFQNEGTADAEKVIITDTLSSLLNFETIDPDAASHEYTYKVTGSNVISFTFKDINLVPRSVNEQASRGFVKFTIIRKKGIPVGSVISNSANIYFDYNLPIITDTIHNTLVLCHTPEVNLSASSVNVCEGDLVQMNCTATYPYQSYAYTWSANSNVTQSISNPTIKANESGKIRVIVTEVNGCSSSDSIDLQVNPMPAAFEGNNASLCMGGSMLLGDEPDNGYIYNWQPAAMLDDPGSSSPLFTPANTGAFTFHLSVQTADGCIGKDTIEVLVDQCAGILYGQNSVTQLRAYPNPVSRQCKISYTLKNGSDVKLELYNSQGVLMETLVDNWQSASDYIYNLSIEKSGIYILYLNINEDIYYHKIVVE